MNTSCLHTTARALHQLIGHFESYEAKQDAWLAATYTCNEVKLYIDEHYGSFFDAEAESVATEMVDILDNTAADYTCKLGFTNLLDARRTDPVTLFMREHFDYIPHITGVDLLNDLPASVRKSMVRVRRAWLRYALTSWRKQLAQL